MYFKYVFQLLVFQLLYNTAVRTHVLSETKLTWIFSWL